MKRILFATAIGICAGLSQFSARAETTQLDIYRDNAAAVDAAVAAYKHQGSASVQLKAALRPVDDKDNRRFLIWSPVNASVSESEQSAELPGVPKPSESILLKTTDFSPNHWDKTGDNDVYELRTYIATEGHLSNLQARFRDHTIKLFERHGMTNIAYFELLSDSSQSIGNLLKCCSVTGQDTCNADINAKSAPVALVYLLSHQSQDAAAASFNTFRSDEDWIKARTRSEEVAGGSLTVGNGVKSLFLRPINTH